MTYHAKIWLGAAIVVSELAIVATHWDEARALQRVVYQTLWKYAPKPAGYVPPDRFAPRKPDPKPQAERAIER
jgi:hypothetical protein